MNNNEWNFIDSFNIREAAVAAVGCSLEVVDILPDDWSCDEQVKKSKLYKGTARKIKTIESQLMRAARAYVELGVVGEFEFFKPDDFTNTDFAYRNQIYISRESLRRLFEKKCEFPEAFKEVKNFEATDSNYVSLSERNRELEAENALYKERKLLGVSGATASNVFAVLTEMIIKSKLHPNTIDIATQEQLHAYIGEHFIGTGLKLRSLEKLYGRINVCSKIIKNDKK